MADVELKPCPFCGGEAKIEKHVCAVYVACTVCKASSVSCTAMLEKCALDVAVEAWNKRDKKRGYWKKILMSEATGWDLSLTGGYDVDCEYVCSECGECCNYDEEGKAILSEYCPHCGTRMDGDS